MPVGRRPSWSASSQRRSSLSKAQGGVGGVSTKNNATASGVDAILDVSQFTKQMNPRNQIQSSLPTRDVSCITNPCVGDKLDIGDDDDDDDDFRLDNILSCIVNDQKVDKGKPLLERSVARAELRGADNIASMEPKHSSTEAGASSSTLAVDNNLHFMNEGKNNIIPKQNMRHITPFDFVAEISSHRIESPPMQNTNPSVDEVDSPVSEEENDKLWSDERVTGQKRMIANGAESKIRLKSKLPMSIRHTGGESCGGSSFVDSILDDIQLNSNNRSSYLSEQEPDILAPLMHNEVTPPRGRFSTTNNTRASQANPNVLGTSKQRKAENETSTLSETTESPFIYTYKSSVDDDSVSQITSSLAGSTPHMQSIPTIFGASSRSTNIQINRPGLTWMNNENTIIGGGSRMIHRKGLYGRDRVRKLPKISAFASSGIGAWSNEDCTRSGGKNNMDEIAYALNTDCTPVMNQRQRATAIIQPFPNGGCAHFSKGGENKSTELSRHRFAEDVKTNVSRLGMGGMSCGAQSVSEGTADTETTASTLGFFQNLALLAWRAQHSVGSYLFPIPSAVKQRKKFDRSDSLDSLEDILLEEGSGTLPRRKQIGVHASGHYVVGDDDEIDYFSRAMSDSSNNGIRGSRRSKQNTFVGRNRATVLGGASLVLTVAFTIVYRSPAKKKFGRHIIRSFDKSSSLGHESVQISDFATDATDDDIERQAGYTDASRLGKINNQVGSEGVDPIYSQQEILDHGIRLPEKFGALADVDDILLQSGTPFYWHVPRSSGGTMNDILGSCLHLTLAADAGGGEGHGRDEELKVLHFSQQVSYVNVDTSTHQGVARAKRLDLVPSGLADVVISPLLHEALPLFSPSQKGRMFAIFRHPVERAASLFYFIQDTQWKQPDTRNEQFADISIEEFYKTGYAENNWMTRFLTNELTKKVLTEDDLEVAKEVLRQKCLVGLMEEKRETFERIQKYFGWSPKNEKDQSCLERKTEVAWSMMHDHPRVEKNSQAWLLIVNANKFDMRLYAYAKELFSQQGIQLFPH